MVAYYNQWLVLNLLAMHPNAKRVYQAIALDEARPYGDIAQAAGVQGAQLDEALNRLLGVGAIVREHFHGADHYLKLVEL